jgi:hypothetical protein
MYSCITFILGEIIVKISHILLSLLLCILQDLTCSEPTAQPILPAANTDAVKIAPHLNNLKLYLDKIAKKTAQFKMHLEEPEGFFAHAQSLVISCATLAEKATSSAYQELISLAHALQITQRIKQLDPNAILSLLISTLGYLQYGIQEFLAMQPLLLTIAAHSILILSPQSAAVLAALITSLASIQLILQKIQPQVQAFTQSTIPTQTLVNSLTIPQQKLHMPNLNLPKLTKYLTNFKPLVQCYLESVPTLQSTLTTAQSSLTTLNSINNQQAASSLCTQLNNFIYTIVPLAATTAQIIQNGLKVSKVTGNLLQKQLVQNPELEKLLDTTITLTQQFEQTKIA